MRKHNHPLGRRRVIAGSVLALAFVACSDSRWDTTFATAAMSSQAGASKDEALTRVRQNAAQFGGFVANTAIKNGKEERPSATLEIRVPSAQFDALLGGLGSLGKVETVTASVQDVGEEYVDMGARVRYLCCWCWEC